MKLLKDSDLLDLVRTTDLIEGLKQPPLLTSANAAGEADAPCAPDPWLGKGSPIQPSSVDLHVGAIYLPETKDDEFGSVGKPLLSHSLRFGHTAVVVTNERLNLPKDIAGFGFPPSHVAFRGLLMINPGHVDPGFEGELRFTVINVGKDDIPLARGDLVFSLLLVKLDAEVSRGFVERSADVPPRNQVPSQTRFESQLGRLSKDFLDVETRAREAAKSAVSAAGFRGPLWTAVLGGLLALGSTLYAAWQPFGKLETRVKSLEEIVKLEGAKSRLDQIDDLKQQVSELKKQVASAKSDGIK